MPKTAVSSHGGPKRSASLRSSTAWFRQPGKDLQGTCRPACRTSCLPGHPVSCLLGNLAICQQDRKDKMRLLAFDSKNAEPVFSTCLQYLSAVPLCQYRGKYSCSRKCDSLSLPVRTATFLLSLSQDGAGHSMGGYLLLEAVMTVVMRGLQVSMSVRLSFTEVRKMETQFYYLEFPLAGCRP